MRRFHHLAATTLVGTIGVILWGAFVRASGSGAGCGSHWPTCNGEVIPRAPSVETLIEYSHRLTSGIAFLLVVATLVVGLRTFEAGHRVRKAAYASLALMITEAAVGAGLVLFEMVAENQSLARGWWMSGHLINTFLLLSAQGLTVWWSRASSARVEVVAAPAWVRSLTWALVLGTLAVGVTGAVAALGDTLFPSTSLREGLAADFSTQSHLLLRLRVMHPFLAVVVAAGLLVLSGQVARLAGANDDTRRAATAVAALTVAQVAAGVVNLLLLAPIWLQIVHLLLADLLWLALVAMTAQVREGWRGAIAAGPPALKAKAEGSVSS